MGKKAKAHIRKKVSPIQSSRFDLKRPETHHSSPSQTALASLRKSIDHHAINKESVVAKGDEAVLTTQ
jgi:hypothetical protein